MDWLTDHQIKGRLPMLAALAGAALLLGLMTWGTLLASATINVKIIAVFLPIIVVPLLIGFGFGFFTLEKRSVMYFIPPFVTYLVLTLYDTAVGLVDKDTGLVRMAWVYFPFLAIMTGVFMVIGSFVAKLVIARMAKNFELVRDNTDDS